ncbi:MAG: dinitrogenase iron-molybdenum cofactor biosynthesis protein [Bacteroidales bacterium]|nr:dinitrogenase iron-molybdenum cofactor biosynthesis protein [Bacteroidales bacterium]
MKIAIPTTQAKTVDAHFGHCEFYTVFTVSDTRSVIHQETVASPQGCGCKSNIAGVLQEMGVTVMLAGNIGTGAINVLSNQGIEVIRGCEGDISKVIAGYLNNQLIDSGETCSHHNDDHTCEH